jgi:signal transduction histidine kinase
MLANLIENSLRHTPPGTRVKVRLERTTSEIRATLADDGPGIPEAAREKVFRRFFRLDASRSSPGSGLGLSFVDAVAALHDIRTELADNGPGLRVTLHFLDPAVA